MTNKKLIFLTTVLSIVFLVHTHASGAEDRATKYDLSNCDIVHYSDSETDQSFKVLIELTDSEKAQVASRLDKGVVWGFIIIEEMYVNEDRIRPYRLTMSGRPEVENDIGIVADTGTLECEVYLEGSRRAGELGIYSTRRNSRRVIYGIPKRDSSIAISYRLVLSGDQKGEVSDFYSDLKYFCFDLDYAD